MKAKLYALIGLTVMGAHIDANALFGLDSPWCMGDGGGTFMCVRVESRAKLSQVSRPKLSH